MTTPPDIPLAEQIARTYGFGPIGGDPERQTFLRDLQSFAEQSAAAERAKIVAWLRKKIPDLCAVYCQNEEIADAIERSEHEAGR